MKTKERMMFGFHEDERGHHGRGHGQSHGRSHGAWCADHGDGEGRGFGRGMFGRGGPGGGRGMGGRGGGRGRRMFGPGDLRLVLLALIEQEPRHGYDLIKAIETAFGGGYAPSPGVVYPNLALLSDEGLIAGVEAGGKQVFSVTEAGKVWLDENRAAVDGVMQRMALAARMVSGEQAPEVVHEALHTLRHAIVTKPGDWSDPETARVVESLMKAVREISGQ
jgi:DNA-binding PadR family transcriptional regulator